MKNSLLAKSCSGLALGLGLLADPVNGQENGALYTMDNAAAANHVLVFDRDERGHLRSVGSVATQGTGTGAAQGLPSQGSVLLSRDGQWLFVCNAGSSDISVLALSPSGLTLTDKAASGGRMPVSLSLRGNLLYVLNAGGLVGDQDNITGFVFAQGKLVALPDSTRGLSGNNTGPAQVSFSHDGNALVVTERVTSLIDTWVVGEDGSTSERTSFESIGATPFGFDVGRENRVFVSEAAGGAANASSASSYEVMEDGAFTVISGAVSTRQTAACWLISSRDGRYVYTANAGSGSISGFKVAQDGTLQLLDLNGQTGLTGIASHPTDMAQSRSGRFLYSLNNGNGTISGFETGADGSLRAIMTLTGLPTSAAGLAGR